MSTSTDPQTTKVKSPAYLAHVMLTTARLQDMIDFYVKILGGVISFQGEKIGFVAYDEEHHRIALAAMPNMKPKDRFTSGLEHLSFTYHTLDDLVLSYQQRKAIGIHPIWCVNHGPTTSIYYQDPDGNHLEMQVENFDTAEEATAFMMTPEFQENPIGIDFQPEELSARVLSGEDHKSIKRRVGSGPRVGPPYPKAVAVQ